MTAFDDWLDGTLPPDAPMLVRDAIMKEQEGRLGDVYAAADGDLPQRLAVMRAAKDWDLVLDMLTVLAMDGVYGRNQEERIAALLMTRLCARGADGDPEPVYDAMEAVLSCFRTYVDPREVCPFCGKDLEDKEAEE